MDAYVLPPPEDGTDTGPNLELDAQFSAMERAAKGKPETQYGNTVEAAQPPDWKEAAQIAQELLARSRDLRVLVTLAIARLHLDGLPGYAAVVQAIRTEIDAHWQGVHPQLDPEDDNDPMQRANALLLLGDPAQVIRPMRDIPLVGTRQMGFVSWRDMAVLNNAVEAPEDYARKTEAQVRGLFSATPPERRAAVRESAQQVLAELTAAVSSFDAQSSPGSAPDLTDLMKLVRDIVRYMERYEPVDGAAEPIEEAPADGAPAVATGGGTAPARAYASITAITAVSTRQEALHALELAASYFRTQEPSSPLPLLIERGKRWAEMPFMELLRDLAPDGYQQAETVVGRSPE